MSRIRWQILVGLILVLGISLTACVAPAAPAGDGMADSGDGDAMMPEVMFARRCGRRPDPQRRT